MLHGCTYGECAHIQHVREPKHRSSEELSLRVATHDPSLSADNVGHRFGDRHCRSTMLAILTHSPTLSAMSTLLTHGATLSANNVGQQNNVKMTTEYN